MYILPSYYWDMVNVFKKYHVLELEKEKNKSKT